MIVGLVAAYALSLRGEFLWDDDNHITKNPTIVGPMGLKEIWTTAKSYYFPLVLTNFWAQHALWGLEPFGYRVVTLAFHIAAALLLWRVLVQLRIPGAWIGAAWWALHPVQVESVAWICELKNTQSAVFFLASIGCYVRWLESRGHEHERAVSGLPPGPRASARGYGFALVFALLAILSKPSTVMLPVVLGLCGWWLRDRIEWRDALRLAPFFALSALAAGWTIWEQKFHSGARGAEWEQSLPERLVIAGRVIWFYLSKLVWPNPLIFIYPRWQISAANPLAYLPALAAAGGLYLLWHFRHRGLRPVFFAAAFFVALLFPVLGFFDVYFFRYSFVGDHFQYLASMGPLVLAGAGLARALGEARVPIAGPAGPTRSAATRPWGVAAGVLVAFGLLSFHHARAYLHNEALWRHTVAKNPAAVMAWLNLADTLARAERHDEAIATFRHALTLRPNDPHGWNDLGCELTLVGRPEEAIPALQRSIELKPDLPEVHSNLGNALRKVGRTAEALASYRRALELDPNHAETHNNLGAELAEMGRLDEAVHHFETALHSDPKNASAHDNFGNVLSRLGRTGEAVARHQEALRLRPDFADAHTNLGRTLLAGGRAAEAVAHFQRALALRPDSAIIRGHLARALAATGRPDDAFAELERAVQLAPDSAIAHNNLGTAFAGSGRTAAAIPHFEHAVRLSPADAPMRVNLGTALGVVGRLDDAALHLGEAIRLRPGYVEAHTQLAVVLVNAGRLDEAVPHFEAALRLQPASAETHDNFGQVLNALGRRREAFHHLEEAARLRRVR
jgi:protein O-mannosyl-transferase